MHVMRKYSAKPQRICTYFVSYFVRGLVKHDFFGRENKKVQTQYTVLSTWALIFFLLVRKGFRRYGITRRILSRRFFV